MMGADGCSQLLNIYNNRRSATDVSIGGSRYVQVVCLAVEAAVAKRAIVVYVELDRHQTDVPAVQRVTYAVPTPAVLKVDRRAFGSAVGADAGAGSETG